ncbi:MAG TPA: translocation/assembly module TamB domain-containing protein [Opitutaceae bacterium]|nr:translocation/assembly module TamB domain-containing protein [Opitutaceae bacterium]
MSRRWIIGFAAFGAVVVVLAATLPWWFGLALRPAVTRLGVTFSAYRPVGYARFELTNVAFRRGGITVTVDRIETDTPLRWWWRHARGRISAVAAGNWSVTVNQPSGPSNRQSGGWLSLQSTLQRVARSLDTWVPSLLTGAGQVHWPSGGLTLKAASWRSGVLTVAALRFRGIEADGTARFLPDKRLDIRLNDLGKNSAIALTSVGADVSGTISGWHQHATIRANFASTGWIPREARIECGHLDLPGSEVRVPAYANIGGRILVEWHNGRFVADLNATGTPTAGAKVPPLAVVVRAHGNTRSVTVEALHASLPGVVADLSAPVTVEAGGRFRPPAAEFSVHADLAKLPLAGATGQITVEARLLSPVDAQPVVDFDLAGRDVSAVGVAVREADAQGRVRWPEFRIDRARIQDTSGDVLQGGGAWNFERREISAAKVAGTIHAASVARWLPPNLKFQKLEIEARAAGPVAEVRHSGRVVVTDVSDGGWRASRLSANWKGTGLALASFTAAATSGPAELTAAGAGDPGGIRLSELTFARGGKPLLRLVQPAQIGWHPGAVLVGLKLAGPEGRLDANVTWGPAGRALVVVHHFDSDWLAAYVALRGPRWIVESAAISASWNHGPMTYSATAGIEIGLGTGRTGKLTFAARGDRSGLRIDALRAVEDGNPVVNVTARVPITVAPGMRDAVVVDPAGAVALTARTVPNAAFWEQLASLTGLELRNPAATANVTGAWSQPRGTIMFHADRLAMDPRRFARPAPAIENIDVAVGGDAKGIRLDRFTCRIEGQLVTITGRLPVARVAWNEFARAPLDFLRSHSQFEASVPDAKVAMFSRFLPAALAPVGQLQADVRYDRGKLGGYLRLRNAASRPLGPLGVLQQVSADVEFSGTRINLRRVNATAGGQPVTVSGWVDLPVRGWMGSSAIGPRYHLSLRGENLPFVRQAGLLVRGDLALALESPAHGPPEIKGKVTLRDSLFLTDVRSFLPHGGGSSPTRRPPYFSVSTAPLNTWVLAVDVSGSRFMRLRTPVFAGVASARFHLGGTLGEPRATGEATIDEGSVLMPFTTFTVQQGAVRLTEEDPYEPSIYLRGTGQHYGYDLTLEIKGKASAPDIAFTSSPALDSEQVLLMVMTGAAPSNEIGSSTTHRAVQIGAFFGQSLLGTLTGSSANPDRLTIESGDKISLQGKETYQIEYKLNGRWSLIGEYDEFDEYNAGFKWRVAPKHLRHDGK